MHTGGRLGAERSNPTARHGKPAPVLIERAPRQAMPMPMPMLMLMLMHMPMLMHELRLVSIDAWIYPSNENGFVCNRRYVK